MDTMDELEDALRILETILEDAQDWNAGDLIEHLEGAIEAMNEAIALLQNDTEED